MDADEGTGFRRTGDAPLTLAWEEEKEGALIIEGFKRAGGKVKEAVGLDGEPVILWCTRSIVA